MERKNSLAIAVGACLILALSVSVLTNLETIDAQECRLIRLSGSAGGSPTEVYIEPRTVRISKGACVVWVNWIIGREISLKFEEGKTCKDGTDAAVPEWVLNLEDNCFVTNIMVQGGTASLKFDEKGIYPYVVETKEGTKATGSIVVLE